ncbi:MAG: hypothetical protein SFX18_01710 [Pirellulales bacterium]|nr:hypothetical protein [Pirellulales bacterium]
MTDTQQYALIKSLCLQQLADLRFSPKPTYELDGQRVAWESYALSLQQTVDWCDQKLRDQEVYEVQSAGLT